jgi:hypothetical protein
MKALNWETLIFRVFFGIVVAVDLAAACAVILSGDMSVLLIVLCALATGVAFAVLLREAMR